MHTNISVEKNSGENNMSVLRRFRRRVKSSGIIPHIKSTRYRSRPKSKLAQKRFRLKKIENIKKREKLYKMGKIGDM